MTRPSNEHIRQFRSIDKAFRNGDLAALEAALGHPDDFPNARPAASLGIGDNLLLYAIYWSPITLIISLIEAGADVNASARDGFPSLLAALSSDRPDRLRVLDLLLDNGADTTQRGINDWTPLHYAVAQRDLAAVEMLLDYSADPNARTTIDDCTTPLEDAEATGLKDAAVLMRRKAGSRPTP